MAESAPDAVLVIDSGSSIVMANARAEALFEYPRTELVGRRIDMLIPHHSRLSSGTTPELTAKRRDGSEFPVEISLSPVQADGRLLLAAWVRDLTARRRSAAELRGRIAATLETLRSKLLSVRDSGTVLDWSASEALRESIDLAAKAAREIQTVSRLLYPRLLDEAGLSEAIRWCV